MNTQISDIRLGSAYKHAKRDRRRNEILDAAATVFAQKGYFAATMQDIAARLGLRSASLYYYFRSKEAALEEVCRRGGREFVDELGAQAESERPVLEILEEGIRLHLDSKWRDYVASFAFNRQNLPNGALAEMNAIARDYIALWRRILDRGKEAGVIRADVDTTFAAHALLAVCNSTATAFPDERQSTGETVSKVVSMILSGICQPAR